ncbi:MAG: MotA/TolQ/ExbB proton channel family protein [Planctomycetota bacterium]|nr:MotA/TolQ/ExbB proton channel family protein [Planctomycetota bacterium]
MSRSRFINRPAVALLAVVLGGGSLAAQETETASPPDEAEGKVLADVAGDVDRRLTESLEELAALNRAIADQSITLGRELGELQREYRAAQDEYRKVVALQQSRALDLGNLAREIEQREEQGIFLSNTLGQYIRNWSVRLPISEDQRYRDRVDAATIAPDQESLSPSEVYGIQAGIVIDAIERLEEALGGAQFEGRALDSSGTLREGRFLVVGPAEFFRSSDGGVVGPVEQQRNSAEPTVVAYTLPEQTAAAEIVLNNARGDLPIDPTLGNARVMEQVSETISEHILKGGPVVWPILALAAASLITAVCKWIGLATVPRPRKARLEALLTAIREHRDEAALEAARAIPGPTGAMLAVGVEHLHEPRALIEEIMYERILATRLRVQRFLPFIAISAAAAPLLGLLGTVTGIIGTFKMITLFGTGNVQTLSGGISEALITTELGLVAAIPALILHAFLYRKARGITDRMEQAAMSFVNQVAVAHPDPSTPPAASGSDSSSDPRREARDAIVDLLSPLLEEKRGRSAPDGGG